MVEQEETKEENDITHQSSQEEKIPRDLQQGVQMYDSVILVKRLNIGSKGFSISNLSITWVYHYLIQATASRGRGDGGGAGGDDRGGRYHPPTKPGGGGSKRTTTRRSNVRARPVIA